MCGRARAKEKNTENRSRIQPVKTEKPEGSEDMRKKLLWISQLIMAVVLLIYAFFSTRVFYENLIDTTEADLKIYMNLFDENDYAIDQEGVEGFSEQLSGLRVTFIDT